MLFFRSDESSYYLETGYTRDGIKYEYVTRKG